MLWEERLAMHQMGVTLTQWPCTNCSISSKAAYFSIELNNPKLFHHKSSNLLQKCDVLEKYSHFEYLLSGSECFIQINNKRNIFSRYYLCPANEAACFRSFESMQSLQPHSFSLGVWQQVKKTNVMSFRKTLVLLLRKLK